MVCVCLLHRILTEKYGFNASILFGLLSPFRYSLYSHINTGNRTNVSLLIIITILEGTWDGLIVNFGTIL